MNNLVFVKLGGSLITDKQKRYHARMATLRRLANEIKSARAADPSLWVLLAHGSGSFGHVAARESGYNAGEGHPSALAFARVGAAASRLNSLVREAFLEVQVPVHSMPPSASAYVDGERVAEMAVEPFAGLLERSVVPITYGDVALRTDGGTGIASTEAIFRYLAEILRPRRLLLLGIVEGVYQHAPVNGIDPPLLREITPHTWQHVRAGLAGSHGTDVTGGMVSKVAQMLDLVVAHPEMTVRIVSGEQEGLLEHLLLNPSLEAGTLIHAGES